ncbi:MAG TPA: hypothetical protein VMV74_11810 [Bacteroidales bacterium]|nr:hypothetical protein [Bacteroidales bacterium]
MKRKRQSMADERHDVIMREYENVIKELVDTNRGNLAPHVSRKHIYDCVAERLNDQWSIEHIRSVIGNKLRERNLRTK